MTSVREALDVVGQAVSIKALAHQRNADFPLSLREFVGALPAGRLHKKVIPLEALKRKFDTFFNQREPPLLQLRLHGDAPGASTFSVLFHDPLLATGYDVDHPIAAVDLAGPGEVLTARGHRYRFVDVRSKSLSVDMVSRQPVIIDVGVQFETEGVEMVFEGTGDIDFVGFLLHLNLVLGSHDGSLDLAGFVDLIDQLVESASASFGLVVRLEVHFQGREFQGFGSSLSSAKEDLRNRLIRHFIYINVAVDAAGVPDGVAGDKIESEMTTKIFEALTGKERDRLKQAVTRWLLGGGDFHVIGVSSDAQALTIDYVIPSGQLEPFPENPQPPLDPGRLANIDHIVVLMMENRSFDHMLGYLSKAGGRPDVDGLRGGEKNRYKGRDYAPDLLPHTQFIVSPPHGHESIENQIDGGKMDGFVTEFAKHCEEQDVHVDPGMIMGYYNKAQVQVYDDLAKHFLICQHWFAAHPGPAFPNRFYTLTGRLNRDGFGSPERDNPHGDAFKPVFTKTIFDHLTEHGVSWRYYEHRYCFLRMFERYTFDDLTVRPFLRRFDRYGFQPRIDLRGKV